LIGFKGSTDITASNRFTIKDNIEKIKSLARYNNYFFIGED